ncbi:MAG TPA: hypothetical protein VMX14_03760 [Anaerolineae bacterium]|nr:hypothetical protein [Anaerolineae bacterium]HUW11287.1 hypothetical protein [Anaerolineae bacterium]
MKLLILKRDRNAETQIVGEFIWENGDIVTMERAVEGAHAIMEGIRPELDASSEKAARSSMQRVARRYSGVYLWARYEP